MIYKSDFVRIKVALPKDVRVLKKNLTVKFKRECTELVYVHSYKHNVTPTMKLRLAKRLSILRNIKNKPAQLIIHRLIHIEY